MGPLKIRQRLLHAILKDVFVPALASGEDLDTAIDALKQALVEHLDRYGVSRDVIARHFGKSERWVYRQLQGYEPSGQPEPTNYRLMIQSFAFFNEREPGGATLDDCYTYLKQKGHVLEHQFLAEMLKVYVGEGLLSEANGLFRAARPTGSPERLTVTRLERVETRLPYLWPLLRDFAEGQDSVEFTGLEFRVTQDAYDTFRTSLKEATKRLMAEAVSTAILAGEDAELINVHGVLTFGQDTTNGRKTS